MASELTQREHATTRPKALSDPAGHLRCWVALPADAGVPTSFFFLGHGSTRVGRSSFWGPEPFPCFLGFPASSANLALADDPAPVGAHFRALVVPATARPMLAVFCRSAFNCFSAPRIMALQRPLGKVAACLATHPLHGACHAFPLVVHLRGSGPLHLLLSSAPSRGALVINPEGFLIGEPLSLPFRTLAPYWHWSPE